MAHFLNVAYKVLNHTKQPLNAKEIVEIAKEKNWLLTKGKTPDQSMKARLSTDILNKKENSLFMRIEKGKFCLRSWQEDEYIADRFKKSLLDEDVMVFSSDLLKNFISDVGLNKCPIINGQELANNCKPMLRNKAEQDFTVIQLISVFIVKYKSMYLTYKRTKRLPEGRLHGFYSIMFGGHLNPDDMAPLFDIFNSQNYAFLERELREEVILKDNLKEIQFKGLLYDDSVEISKQHLGIVYDVVLKSPKYKIGERGFLMDSKFETLEKIGSRIHEFENWSVMIYNHEKGETKVIS